MTTVPPNSLTLAGSFRNIVTELGEIYFERRDVIETLVICLLAKEHGFIVGPPGTSKSAMLRSLCERMVGAEFWQILMDRQLGKEESFGPIDIPEYEKNGRWTRNIKRTFATANVALVDEAGKAGPASLNPYLMIMNERLYKDDANGDLRPVPLISAFGASNEVLEPELSAMWDRFLVRVSVDYIQEPGNFARLLNSAVTPEVPGTITTITLAELEDVITNHVPRVTLPAGIIESVLRLRVDLRNETIIPSDRRWKQSVRLLQASAWLNGRCAVEDDDLAILRHVLWDVVEQFEMVEKMVLSLTSPMVKVALALDELLDDINAGIDSRHGQSVEARSRYGGEAQYKLVQIEKDLTTQIDLAVQQGRSTVRLDEVADKLKATFVHMLVDCMNLPLESALTMHAKTMKA